MSLDCNFSKATPLRNIYKHNLLEDYDYRDNNTSLFSTISTSFKILVVKKVYNPHLYGMYLLCKEELLKTNDGIPVKEQMLYHATSPINARNIAQNNIDWRKTTRSKYGIGACFSPSPTYAHKYSSSDGAFIIFKVLMKQIDNIGISYNLEVPSNAKFDTTLDHCGNVYVKYDDYNFYPKFIVHYSFEPNTKYVRRGNPLLFI